MSLITDHLLPWYIAHGGVSGLLSLTQCQHANGEPLSQEPGRAEAVQCSLAGSNAYSWVIWGESVAYLRLIL